MYNRSVLSEPSGESMTPEFGQNDSSKLIRPWKAVGNIKSTTIFCIIWNFVAWSPVLMFGIGSVTVNGKAYYSLEAAYAANPITATVILFPLIGLLMIYHNLAMWMNKTELKLENGHLILNNGPIPWFPREVRIPVNDIKQAYVQEFNVNSDSKVPVMRYCLMVQRISSGDTVIENDISHYSEAEILETWLEKNLKIENVEVPDEVDFITKAS